MSINYNKSLARVRVGHENFIKCFKGNEIEDGTKDIILNNLTENLENIKFGDLKEAFISFKNIKSTSNIFKDGGFLSNLDEESKSAVKNGNAFFWYQKDKFEEIKGKLGEDEEVCIIIAEELCISAFSISASREISTKQTYCGTWNELANFPNYEISLDSSLQIMCEKGVQFFKLVLKDFFNYSKYLDKKPDEMEMANKATDFIFFINWQNNTGKEECCNMYFAFKANISSATFSKDITNIMSDFSPTLVPQGVITNFEVCETMEIFGDQVKKKPQCETLMENVDKTISSTAISEEKAKILTKQNPELEREALDIINKKKEKADIILFSNKLTEGKNCSEKQKQDIYSKLVKNFSKQQKTHFQEWKEMLQSVVNDTPEDEEKFVTACVFDRSLVVESDLHYARAIFKKEVGEENVKGFFLGIAPFIQHATEDEYQAQANDLAVIIKNWWNTK